MSKLTQPDFWDVVASNIGDLLKENANAIDKRWLDTEGGAAVSAKIEIVTENDINITVSMPLGKLEAKKKLRIDQRPLPF
jgi:hypothetical protein